MKRTKPSGVNPLDVLDRFTAPGRRATALAGAIVLAASDLLSGCVGDLGGDRGGSPSASGLVDVAPAGMRRMTPEQFTSSMRDLFGDPGLDLDLDPDAGEVASLLAVDKLNAAAEAIVARRASWGTPVFPCDTSGADDEACVDSFVRTFGRRAFRRTLDEAEVAMLKDQYARARKDHSFEDALLVVLETMIQSPNVYYFVELGRDGDGSEPLASGVRTLTGWERASRLSYFLWNTTPDDALLDAAESGALDTAEGVRAQAERLLSNDRARATARRFFADWLELDGTNKHASLESAPKSPEIFPEDSPALRAAMRAELEALAERVLFEGDGRFESLLTTTDAYVNGAPRRALRGGGPRRRAHVLVGLPPRSARGDLHAGGLPERVRQHRGQIADSAAARTSWSRCSAALGPPPPNASDVPVRAEPSRRTARWCTGRSARTSRPRRRAAPARAATGSSTRLASLSNITTRSGDGSRRRRAGTRRPPTSSTSTHAAASLRSLRTKMAWRSTAASGCRRPSRRAPRRALASRSASSRRRSGASRSTRISRDRGGHADARERRQHA